LDGMGVAAVEDHSMNANSRTRRRHFLSLRGTADRDEHGDEAKKGWEIRPAKCLHGRRSRLMGDQRSLAGCWGESFDRILRKCRGLRAFLTSLIDFAASGMLVRVRQCRGFHK